MVNVFNYEEGVKKIIEQLYTVKKSIDLVGEKLVLVSKKFAENSNSMMIFSSGSMSSLTKITNVYYNYKEFLGYEKSDLIDHKATIIMPEIIA